MTFYYKLHKNIIKKFYFLTFLSLISQAHLLAQACSLSVVAPTLSATTEPLPCADLSNLVTYTAYQKVYDRPFGID